MKRVRGCVFYAPASATRPLDQILDLSETLSSFADRGSVPKELAALGIHEYWQVLARPVSGDPPTDPRARGHLLDLGWAP